MIPVYQTIIDKNHGNCMQAAIASLIELPLDAVPNFIETDSPMQVLADFMHGLGYNHECTLYNHVNSLPEYITLPNIKDYNGINGFFYASVYSPRFYDYSKPLNFPHNRHAVIIDKDFNIVHDPNAMYKDIKYPLHELLGYNGILMAIIFEKNVG